MRTLVVANHGKPDGYPFNKLFDKVENISDGDVFNATRLVSSSSGLLLWGGTDICPMLYGEEPNKFNEAGINPSRRDLFEWTLIKAAVAENIPIIGVCRGAQLLCAFDGGKLAQDIGGHSGGHNIVTKDGEVFWAAANHHQMMLPKPHNTVLATSTKQLHEGYYIGEKDMINHIPIGLLEPEAVHFTHLNAVGFQPHPEWMGEENEFVDWCLTTVKELLL